jgi:hypothetical protein
MEPPMLKHHPRNPLNDALSGTDEHIPLAYTSHLMAETSLFRGVETHSMKLHLS